MVNLVFPQQDNAEFNLDLELRGVSTILSVISISTIEILTTTNISSDCKRF